MGGGGGGYRGGGKRKAAHWAVRRKNKQAKREAENGEGGDKGESKQASGKKNQVDRRAGFPEEIHPGSYAVQYFKQKKSDQEKREAKDGEGEGGASTSAAAGGATNSNDEKEPVHTPVPKKRFGLWVAFCGKKYSGMQMNEGVQTIEAELERALFQAGGIAEANYGFLQKVGWSRAGRTDKGVHAAGQMVTAKLHVGDDVPAFMARVNEHLPAEIRVMHMVTTTKNFNAKLSCDKRTYEYLAPTFIFAPRGPAKTESTTDHETDKSHESRWIMDRLDRDGEDNDEDAVLDDELPLDPETVAAQSAYRIDEATLARVRRVLTEYQGTHNFHNFTSKLEPTSPKCLRYIMSFTADAPFVANDLEWVRLRVVGQSFLLHHIRKMIGTAADVVAGVTPITTIARAMELDKMDVPKAPSVGLYLAQAHFDVYNQRLAVEGENRQASHPPLELTENSEVADKVEAFKRDFIFEHIIQHERRTRTYARWLRVLATLPFGYAARPVDVWKKEKAALSLITNRAERLTAERAMRAQVLDASASGKPEADGQGATITTESATTGMGEKSADSGAD